MRGGGNPNGFLTEGLASAFYSSVIGRVRVRNVLILLSAVFAVPAMAAEVTGAGSTFVYPLISKWAASYKAETGVAVNYQSIGSGGGIKQIEAKTVDFGATDMPLKSAELEAQGVVQFPIVNGAVVPVVNIPGVGVGEIKLSAAALSDIYLGKIKNWNDPAIAKLNSGLKLPNQGISVVHRSDGSGTSFIFTNYLAKVSSEWKEKVGEGTAVNWPTGVGGKGNEGVAAYVKQIRGSIGYIEYAYALQNKMNYVKMQNAAGGFVEPSTKTFAAASQSADWAKAKDFYLILTNAKGKNTWPIAGSTFGLVQKRAADPTQTKQVLEFFRWAWRKGQGIANELNYVPLPASTVKLIERKWKAAKL